MMTACDVSIAEFLEAETNLKLYKSNFNWFREIVIAFRWAR